MNLPTTPTLITRLDARGVLAITLNRPARKNAMNDELLGGLLGTLAEAKQNDEVRAVVLRGAGGTFCAGADLKDLAPGATAQTPKTALDELARFNRQFGAISEAANHLDVPVVAVLEGAAMGGGFGLTCVADIALAHMETFFGLPETRLGLVPAQIAPFVIQRIGVMATRRLALTGARFQANEARALGLIDEVYCDTEALNAGLDRTLGNILRCEPKANRATKQLLRRLSGTPNRTQLDAGATLFAKHALSAEGQEGTAAFVQKRRPSWSL